MWPFSPSTALAGQIPITGAPVVSSFEVFENEGA